MDYLNDEKNWEPDKTVDMTPTHKFAAGIYVECLKNGDDPKARAMAEEELIFLGALADARNELAGLIRKIEELDPELLAKAEKLLEEEGLKELEK